MREPRPGRPWRAGVLAASASLAVCAASASGGQYHYSGKLDWRFESVAVRTPAGKTTTSMGSHVYSLNLDGPLGTPLIGNGNLGLTLQGGKSLSNVVAARKSSQELTGYNFGATLLPPPLRRFINLSPNFSRSVNKTSWGDGALHNITDAASGVTAGLTLPKLPTYSVTYQKLRRTDDSSYASDQETDIMDERALYMKGVLRAEYQRRRQTTRDLLGRSPDNEVDSVNSSVDLNDADFNRLGLRSYFMRVSYAGQTNRSVGSTSQRGVSSLFNLTSRTVRSGGVKSYLGYTQGLNRDLVSKARTSNSDVTAYSSYSGSSGTINNQLQFRNIDGPAGADRSVSDNLNSEVTLFNGLAGHRLQLAETLSWGAQGARGTDLIEQRVSVYPAAKYDFYVDQRYSAARSAAAGALNQGLGWGGGVNWRPAYYARGDMSYQEDLGSDLAKGSKTRSDTVTMKFSAEPAVGLSATLICAFYSNSAELVRSRNGTLSLETAYSVTPALTFSGSLYRTDTRQRFRPDGGRARTVSLDYSARMVYNIGRTTLSLLYESREASVFNAYSRFGAFLTRTI
ncbi:MAG: hypothetical protein M0025_12185 [Elusimicrobia bacterium]|nr:hypothetical protein [Elusimicrobiota bacterium]